MCLLFAAGALAQESAPTTGEATATDSVPPEASTEQISLELWLVTLENASDGKNDDELDPLLARLGYLSTSLGSRDTARALVARLEERKAVRRIKEFRVTTLSGHDASFVTGERTPTITGVTMTDLGQSNNIIYQQIGTAVSLTPWANADGSIRVRVKAETSDIEESKDVAIVVPKNGKGVFGHEVRTSHIDTMVSVASGETMLVGKTFDDQKLAVQLVLLSAQIVKPESR
jgi:type II secretory pathway component GspD/PulD (secretin)